MDMVSININIYQMLNMFLKIGSEVVKKKAHMTGHWQKLKSNHVLEMGKSSAGVA